MKRSMVWMPCAFCARAISLRSLHKMADVSHYSSTCKAARSAILGIEAWALRIVPALTGILTVAIMLPLGRTLFRDTPRARYVGLAAAAAMAVMYWHMNFSRLGFRAILLPATSALTIWWFWHGWQTKNVRYLILSGIALGISLYTYLSARLLPFVLIGFAVAVIFFYFWNRWRNPSIPPIIPPPSKADWKFTLRAVVIVFVVMAVVLIPIGLYFYQHTEDLIGRRPPFPSRPKTSRFPVIRPIHRPTKFYLRMLSRSRGNIRRFRGL